MEGQEEKLESMKEKGRKFERVKSCVGSAMNIYNEFALVNNLTLKLDVQY